MRRRRNGQILEMHPEMAKQDLRRLYIKEKLNIKQISEIFKVSNSLISYYLHKFKIYRENYTKNYLYTGFEEISGQYYGNIKRRAKQKDLEFNISLQYLWNLFIQQNRRCALSGLHLKFHTKSAENTASLDRIDSNKGYIVGNVQWVHKNLNMMKLHFQQEYFVKMCGLVSEYMEKKC